MKKSISLIAVLTLCLAGCFVPSVNPLYTEKDLVVDPALAGTWGKADDPDREIFARDGQKAYQWTAIEKDATNVFRAHLVQLGEHRFLDAVLVRTSEEWKGVGRAAVVMRPAHIFFKVHLTNSTLRLDALNVEWLEKLLKESPQALAHERIREPDVRDEDGRVLLTASTSDLQRFVLKYASDTSAFPESDGWPRIEGTAAK